MEHKWIRLHWVNYVALFLFLCFGIALFIAPIYLAPPHLEKTGYVYMALLCLWLPFLLIFGRWQGRRYTCAHPAAILLGMMLSCCWLMVLAPILVMPEPLRGFPMNCTEESLGEDRVRYTCIQESSDAPYAYIMEGREGFPFVWLKERDFEIERTPIAPAPPPTETPATPR